MTAKRKLIRRNAHKMIAKMDGTYTIRIHSNLWYDLASENKGPDSEPDVNFPCDCSVAKGQKFTFEILHVLDVEETGYAFADMTCENCGSMQIVRVKVISQSVVPALDAFYGVGAE